MVIKSVNLLQDGQAIAITWPNGETSRFHAIWLRDNALDPETRSSSNGQRLVTLLDYPEDMRIEWAKAEGSSLAVRFLPDGKEVSFPASWLAEHRYDNLERRQKGWTGEAVSRWGAELASAIPSVDFNAAKHDRRALGDWLRAVRRYGFAVMTGLKPEKRGAARGRRSFRLRARDQLRALVRGPFRGKPGQSGLHRTGPAGAQRQPLPRSGADSAASGLPGELCRRWGLQGGRRVQGA